MKLPDDLLPEEQDPRYEELITLLQQANLNPLLVDPTERAQILSRAKARLFQTDLEASFSKDIPLPADGGPGSPPSKPEAQTGTQRPGRQFVRLLNALAAVLIVGALVGAMLLLLASHRRAPGTGGIAEKGCMFTSTTGFVHEYNLSAVTALSRNDIWVVGGFYVPARDPHALLEHWNGSQWCICPDPYPITGMESVSLRAIAAASTNDVWAVGNVDNAPVGHTLIEHWNGSRWSVTPNPINGGVLQGVAALSSTDAWAVGSAVSGGGALIEHWNGKQWSLTPNSFTPLYIDFRGITALSANDVWAVGSVITDTHVQDTTHTVIAHWNGQRWSIVPSPNPGTSTNELWGVTALSANDVWAVGGFSNRSTQRQIVDKSLTMHWNGSRWSVVSSPSPGNIGNDLTSVTARSANDVWAVGTPYNNLIEHWDGSRWSVVRTSNHGADQGLSAVALVPHSTTIVAVGGWALLYIKDPDGESLSKP
jgi:hypothetical protein